MNDFFQFKNKKINTYIGNEDFDFSELDKVPFLNVLKEAIKWNSWLRAGGKYGNSMGDEYIEDLEDLKIIRQYYNSLLDELFKRYPNIFNSISIDSFKIQENYPLENIKLKQHHCCRQLPSCLYNYGLQTLAENAGLDLTEQQIKFLSETPAEKFKDAFNESYDSALKILCFFNPPSDMKSKIDGIKSWEQIFSHIEERKDGNCRSRDVLLDLLNNSKNEKKSSPEKYIIRSI